MALGAFACATAWAITPEAPKAKTHMTEALRDSVRNVVVLGSPTPTGENLTGSYDEQTPGLLGGMAQGSQMGSGVTTEVGNIPVSFPIPILTLPGMIAGGISGAIHEQVQDLRDALTEDLASADSQPLRHDALAMDVFWGLRDVPDIESKILALTTPVPADTDTLLFVNLKEVTIDVDGGDAIITTTANATLRRRSDGVDVYTRDVSYQDRDSLGNWTRNDNALWHSYADFAGHYLAREIVAEVFMRVELEHELEPIKSDGVKRVNRSQWRTTTRTLQPELAWRFTLQGGDAYGSWRDEVADDSTYFDVEIYDAQRLVYAARTIPEHRYRVAEGLLEPCKDYWWSVRPSYHVDGDVKIDKWMRTDADSRRKDSRAENVASNGPAYVRDFVALKVKCGAK